MGMTPGVVSHEQATMLWGRLREQGYANIVDFAVRTRLIKSPKEPVVMSFNTVSRAFSAGKVQPDPDKLAAIMLRLGYSRQAVREYINHPLTDALLEGDSAPPELWEKPLLKAVRKMLHHEPACMQTIVAQLELVGKACGVDVSDDLRGFGRRSIGIVRKTGPRKAV